MPEYQIINGGDTIKISALTPKVINRLLPKYNKIVLNDNLDKPLPKLPDSVTHLTLGSKYNQPLINLPPNLVYLNLKCLLKRRRILSTICILKIKHFLLLLER